mmetsp:Transcript_33887/g.64777  ORF Transcript_33887/g.64777 Transcript_33887/m.64777 type:complete len:219 (+) Transcript_33887:245-901(+)
MLVVCASADPSRRTMYLPGSDMSTMVEPLLPAPRSPPSHTYAQCSHSGRNSCTATVLVRPLTLALVNASAVPHPRATSRMKLASGIRTPMLGTPGFSSGLRGESTRRVSSSVTGPGRSAANKPAGRCEVWPYSPTSSMSATQIASGTSLARPLMSYKACIAVELVAEAASPYKVSVGMLTTLPFVNAFTTMSTLVRSAGTTFPASFGARRFERATPFS